MEFIVKIKLEKSDDCHGCPLINIPGHGRQNYCKLGFGDINHKYRDKKNLIGHYWQRPKSCKDEHGE